MKTQRFVFNGEFHMIDEAGNHFIGDRCVNPKSFEAAKIGSTYPPMEGRTRTYNS